MHEEKKCGMCGKSFIAKQKRSLYCSRSCSHRKGKIESLKKSTGKIVCKICGARYNSKIVSHINSMHNMSLVEYQKQTGATKEECFSKEYLDKKLGFKKGKENPAWKHGGVLSPWSKKSNFYSEESHIKAKNNRNYTSRISYWLEKTGGDVELAKKLHKKRQATFSKKICIEKYGKTEGLERFNKRQKKWQENLLAKSPEEIDRINKAKMTKGFNCISNGEKSLLLSLLDYFPNLEAQVTIKNKIFDIVDKENKKIIEYNGVFWHAKPTKYHKDYIHPITKKTAEEIWEKDKHKIDMVTKEGYSILIVWEDEYNENKSKSITECRNFLDPLS